MPVLRILLGTHLIEHAEHGGGVAMTENTMQCCYTNAVQEVGGKISSGWQPVAVSDNIPSEAYNGCISLQNANATIQAPMVDERGNVLNLYEITGDGSFVYVSRTQYGLVDRLGRPNMFSHAYIFSWKKEDVLETRTHFLRLTGSNFAEDEQTASTTKNAIEQGCCTYSGTGYAHSGSHARNLPHTDTMCILPIF